MNFNINNSENNLFWNYLKYMILAALVIMWIAYVGLSQTEWISNVFLLLLATSFAIYMAINLWANDVANNMGPAVWSKALTLTSAIIIAVIFEAWWAMIAGWDVVDTIKWWIINWDMIGKWSKEFIAVMLSTMLWAALWVNVATYLKAPVSITHAIFGWLIWAWITSAIITWISNDWFSLITLSNWLDIVNWSKVWSIAWAWIVAILMWAAIATWLFVSIKRNILKKDNKWEAAKIFVPLYVWFMAWIFSTYLILKWFKNKIKWTELDFLLDKPTAIFIWVLVAAITYLYLRTVYNKHKEWFFRDKTKFVNTLFNLPLIVAVALLSFAHGANDVANAIWPLAAINEALQSVWSDWWKVSVPFWIMLFWAVSLSWWLAVFGWRLIKTVWNEITKLDQIKAYCIALSAAITVILASAMGLPVSTTQIAIWWVFWIGLYREYLKRKKWKNKVIIDKSMVKWIVKSWVMTLPLAWAIASLTYMVIISFI